MKEITSIEEMKIIEMEVMKKIHDFCISHDISYFLSHGTLIGAVRHNGFIPWDDDIDIYMPRPEYDRFSKIFPLEEVRLNLKLMTGEAIGRPVIKVADTRTIIYESEYKDSAPVGVWVDIWPLDGISSYDWKYRFDMFRVRFYNRVLYYKKLIKVDGLFNTITQNFVRIIPEKFAFNRITNIMTLYDYNKSERVISFCDPYKKKLKKEWFSKSISHQFEDSMFYIPSGFDSILREIYGDYMKLPPEDKQKPHHIVNVFWK